MTKLYPHAALIYTMVLVSAADGSMDDKELKATGDIVRHLPAFEGFQEEELPNVAQTCSALLSDEDEMTVLQQIRWRINIDRLTAAAIERGSRARHQTV